MITGLWVKALIYLLFFSFHNLRSRFLHLTVLRNSRLEFSANPNHFRLGNTIETTSLAVKVRS